MRTAFKLRLPPATQDLIWATLLIALLPALAYNLDDFVATHGWRFGWVLVDVSLVLCAFLIFGWFSWRRSRQYK